MPRFSFNPYHRFNKNLSPQSFRDLIVAQKRRIKELTTSILQAEGYLTVHPECKPVLSRLGMMRKDYLAVCVDLAKSERRLVELLERIREDG